MQKKIIALAVAGLMSGAAFAQSNVTISGNLDAGWYSNKAQGSSAAETAAAYNNSTTSLIGFRATEDLGGGMKAGVYVESDIRGNTAGDFGSFQRYVWMGGNFGEVTFGQRNNYSLTAALTAQPFGTGLGGAYSGTFNRLDGVGYDAYGTLAGAQRDARADNSLRYDLPKMGGFSAGVTYRDKNDGNETTRSSGHVGLGLGYNAGPLNVAYAYAKIANPTAAVASVGSLKHNMFGINYGFGPATVYFGYTTSKGDAAAAGDTNARSWNIAAKFAVSGNVDLMANFVRDNDRTAANADRKLNGLGADYKFSKRTAAYVRYEGGDTNTNNSAAGKFTRYALGLRHSF